MFEQLVRPFAARPVTATRRIVPTVISEPVAETAVISWGKAGKIAVGVRQPDGTNLENIETFGFRLRSCTDNWTQSSVKTEEKEIPVRTTGGTEIGTTTVNRIREIGFHRREGEVQPPPTAEVQPRSFVAAGVSEVIAGLRRDIPGSNSCDATYKFNYD